jgi:hypothetical protein
MIAPSRDRRSEPPVVGFLAAITRASAPMPLSARAASPDHLVPQ